MNNISYIIPHYNNVNGLKRLLKSIQLNTGDEIIIVDDCSDCEQIEALKTLESKEIKIYSTEVNGGAGKARNIGLSKSKNSWILFADSDDFFVKGYNKKISEFIIQNNFDVIYFSPTSIVESINKSVRSNRHEYYEFLIRNFKHGNVYSLNEVKYKMVVPWSKLISKEFIEKNSIQFDEVMLSNDVMFSAKVGFYAERVCVKKEIIYCCVETDNSLTANVSFSSTKSRQKIFIDYYIFLSSSLNKKEFKNLNLTGLSFIMLGIRNKYNYKQIINIYKEFKTNQIPIVNYHYIKNFLYRRLKVKERS